jgi:hypothetical protein
MTTLRSETRAQDIDHLRARMATLQEDGALLKRQLEWYRRQIIDRKPEKRLDTDPAEQGNLLRNLR